jgi:hypothetical protein
MGSLYFESFNCKSKDRENDMPTLPISNFFRYCPEHQIVHLPLSVNGGAL